MKKYKVPFGCLIIAMLVITANISAGDKVILLTDAISAADTVGGTPRADTAYSSIFKIEGATILQFFIDMVGASDNDTNWVDDTFFVDIQHSFDKTNWRLFLIDTLVANGVGWSKLNVAAADSVIGDYARVRFIHWDSLNAAADHTGLFGNSYKKKLYFYYSIKK